MRTVRLVLATAPVSIEDRYGEYAAVANTEPSFGLVSLAASARRAGAEVSIVEAAAHNLSVYKTADAVLSSEADILGISSTTIGIAAAAHLASRVKEQNSEILVLIGGCHVSALPEETLTEFPQFDVAVIGEGEETLTEIINHRQSGNQQPAGLPGTYERIGDQIVANAPRSPIEDLDTLPMPAWDLLDGFPASFRPSPARVMRWPCASIVMTRGCPNACTFCDRSVFGRHCRSYSPTHAADICEDLMHNYGVRELLIEDDTFIISRKNVTAFCQELIDRDLHMSWSCLGRADRVDPELLRLMKKAGCWHISFGIESGDEDILQSVNKNLNLEQIASAVTMCREAGMRTKGFFIVGFPGESDASLKATENLVRTLPLDDITVMHLTPFPGSELARKLTRSGHKLQEWRSMNALSPIYVPEGMSAARLEEARNSIYKAFFRRPDVLWRHALHAAMHPRLVPFYLSGAKSLFSSMRQSGK